MWIRLCPAFVNYYTYRTPAVANHRAQPSHRPMSSLQAAAWSKEEDKAFENAVAAAAPPPLDGLPEDEWFVALAASVPARSTEEVRRHYEALVEDVGAIEAGRVPLPRYAGEEPSAAPPDGHKNGGGGAGHRREDRKSFDSGKSCSKAEQERRKGIPWTEEEHRCVQDILLAQNCSILLLLLQLNWARFMASAGVYF